jgi:hypothetical protein
MRHYKGNEKVAPGIYFNASELVFRSVEEEGTLPGDEETTWRAVPVVVMLLAGPVLGLLYAMFLPFIGFAMLATVTLGWVGKAVRPMLVASTRVLRPAWEPALAFLGRGKAKRPAKAATEAAPKTDEWAEEVRAELAETADDEGRES